MLGQQILKSFPTTVPVDWSEEPVLFKHLNAEVQAFQIFLDKKMVAERRRNLLITITAATLAAGAAVGVTLLVRRRKR